MGGAVPKCPASSTDVITCTEGVSLAPLIADPHSPVKRAALSVYPRGPPKKDGATRLEELDVSLGSSPSMSHCLNGQNRGCTMGYSMMTRSGDNLYRYTEWVGFAGPSANFRPDWDTLVATELYNHTTDAAENDNVA